MSLVRTFNKHDHKNQSCVKCKSQFKIGDRVVSTTIRHTYSKQGTKRYHTRCYVDAHGEPIFE